MTGPIENVGRSIQAGVEASQSVMGQQHIGAQQVEGGGMQIIGVQASMDQGRPVERPAIPVVLSQRRRQRVVEMGIHDDSVHAHVPIAGQQKDIESAAPSHPPLSEVVDRLYEEVQPQGDRIIVTAFRNAEDYKRLLGLEDVPLASGTRVLDIGSGRATIEAADFGLETEALTRADLFPNLPGIEQANMLHLPYEDGAFGEVWVSFVMRYVDAATPYSLQSKFEDIVDKSGAAQDSVTLTQHLQTILGLQAISETLRVTGPEGRVRFASYEYDFEQSSTFRTLEEAIAQGRIQGLRVNRTQVSRIEKSGQDWDANLFLEKDPDFDGEAFKTFVDSEFRSRIPAKVAQALTIP